LLQPGLAMATMVLRGQLYRARQRDFAGTHYLFDPERTNQPDERLDLVGVARHFHRDRTGTDIDHVSAKSLHDRVEFRSRAFVNRDFDDDHLAIDGFDPLEVRDLDYGHEFVELLVDLLEDLVVARADEHDSRDGRIQRILIYRQRFDVEAATGKQARDPCEHAEFILNQYRYRMAWHPVSVNIGESARYPAT